MPLLSIITITKDDPAGLAATLDSTDGWRSRGVEHTVVNGGGPLDGLLRQRTGGAPPPRVLERPARGISDAFNTGIHASTGEWLWFLNGGDRIDSRLDFAFLSSLLTSNNADMVVGGLTYEGEENPKPHPPPRFWWPPLLSWIPHPATLLRRRIFERFGQFDSKYSIVMDYDFWLRTLVKDVTVDVLSVPFAVFAPGGVSQVPEARERLENERAQSVRAHQVELVRDWLGASVRLFRATGDASIRGLGRRKSRP